jgi:hypothetical protein
MFIRKAVFDVSFPLTKHMNGKDLEKSGHCHKRIDRYHNKKAYQFSYSRFDVKSIYDHEAKHKAGISPFLIIDFI